ncbi:MAG: 4'-phosphopantetheinyl transferase superfamily protein [Lachnospiraceae bacterium]|nr:4'-phosphopantetheinyl transferase superfamily protein [Lachnospiraceae bacterium]
MTDTMCGIYRIHVGPDRFRPREISRIGYDFLPEAAGHFLRGICKMEERDSGVPEDHRYAVERREGGKPFFPNCPEIKFNISNSGEWIYIALSTVEVGIDVQKITGAPLDRIAKRVFNPKEYDGFTRREDQRAYFFREWALRESYIKWTGEGLARDMRNLPHDAWQSHLPVPEGYVAAITAAEPLLCVDTEILYDRQRGFIWKK